jgi:chromosome segregation ATPase
MAKAKFDIKTEATRPFYAYVGATDRAVEAFRESVADFQKRIADFDFEPQALRDRAAKLVAARVEALSEEAQDRRAAIEARVAELQERYDELVTRGETLVERIRKQESSQAAAKAAGTASAKAKTTSTQAGKASKTTAAKAKSAAKSTSSTAKSEAARPKSSAKATGTAARKAAANGAQATVDGAKKVGD